MSRRNIIIAVVIVVLLGAAAGYYFLYYTEDEPQQLTEDTTQVTQEQTTQEEEQVDEDQETAEEPEDEGEEPQSIEEEIAADEEIELPEKFAYRNEIRNPFGNIQNQQQAEPEVTKEELTIPFRLDGIITNGNQQIAIISTSEGPRFITGNESIGDYYISNVTDEQIRIRYKYLTVYMKIGGALVE